MGWTISGLNPKKATHFFSSPTHPEWQWDSCSLLFNGYGGFFPEVKQPGCEGHSSPLFSTMA